MSEPESTVVLLGAGASRASDYKLPTMKGFFSTDVLTPETRKEGEKYYHLWKFLEDYYGVKHAIRKNLKKVNLEEVMSHLYGSLNSTLPIDQERRAFLASAREELSDYVFERLVKTPPGKKPEFVVGQLFPWKFVCDRHRKVFSKLNAASDSILSINYDMIADGALAQISEWREPARKRTDELNSRNYPAISPWNSYVRKALYIKLHGSLDSVTCHNRLCAKYHVIQKTTKIGRGGNEICGICGTCGSSVALGIVPPVLSKSAHEWRTGLDWSLAFYKLRDARRWAIWGVSLAESDHQLRMLLREAAQDRRQNRHALEVAVLDKNPCVQKRFEEVLGTTVDFFTELDKLVDWIKDGKEEKASSGGA